MKKILTLALALLIGRAMAQPTYPIVDTGLDTFYSNNSEISEPKQGDSFYGQDASYDGNAPSYTDNGDGTITDNVTKLIWQKGYEVMGYDQAVKALKKANNSKLGGYNDWRLPSIKEAYSLIIFSGVDASSGAMTSVPKGAVPFIDTNYFDFEYGSNGSRPIDVQMLTTTFYVGKAMRGGETIFGVNIADGRIKGYPKIARGEAKLYTVRFVRGAEYGENEFHDNGDGTISDRATGLMWQQSDSGKGLDWQESLEYAQKMNKESYLGHNDWRVPNVKELQSIVDYSRSPESSSSAAIDPIFATTSIKNEGGEEDYPFFWSSTTHLSAGRNQSSIIAINAAYLSFGRAMGNMQQMQGRSSNNRANWIDVHGAGAQRSAPKSGDSSKFSQGRGPQGDAVRIDNYVRLVRDL